MPAYMCITSPAAFVLARPNIAQERAAGQELLTTHQWTEDATEAISRGYIRAWDILLIDDGVVLTDGIASGDARTPMYTRMSVEELDDYIAEYVRMPRRMAAWAQEQEENNGKAPD